jgi:hypothetical protein
MFDIAWRSLSTSTFMNNTYTLNIPIGDSMFGAAPLPYSVLPRGGANIAGFSTVGVPGFAPPDAGTFANYRKISAHPTVALAMRIVTAPIVANGWGWSKRRDVPEEWLTFVRDMLQPMRPSILAHGLRALVYGFSAFEKVWELDGGRLRIGKLKALLPEITQILVDDAGNFAGFRQQAPGEATPRDVLGSKAFLFTYEGECGDLYGRSRHENIRVVWSQAMQTAERLAQYQKKIAGVIAQLHYPEGTSRDAAGVERSNDWIAQQVLEAVSMGRSVRFPNLFASIDDPKSAADLAGKSQWVLSQFDPGGTDHSNGLLAALAYYDKQLFRGWLRPERVALEAQHGSRADAMEHTETGIVDSELVDRSFAAAFNAGVIDDVLTLNFGPAARGAVWVEPSPISDSKTTTVRALLAALVGQPEFAAKIAQRVDVEAMLEDLDVPTVRASS